MLIQSVCSLRCKAKSEVSDCRGLKLTLIHKVLKPCLALRSLKHTVVVDCSLAVYIHEPLPKLCSLPVLALAALGKLNMSIVRKCLNSLLEAHVFILHDEVNDASAHTAAKAMIELLTLIYGK